MADKRIDPHLEVREVRRGKRPGDAYIKIVRPYEEIFERGEDGELIATERTVLDRPGWMRTLRRLRTILIGRDHGDWAFPYDPTMSARHAEIRSVPQRDEYVVRDLGSRNGIGVLVRGERAVRGGERLLFGRKMLRADLT